MMSAADGRPLACNQDLNLSADWLPAPPKAVFDGEHGPGAAIGDVLTMPPADAAHAWQGGPGRAAVARSGAKCLVGVTGTALGAECLVGVSSIGQAALLGKCALPVRMEASPLNVEKPALGLAHMSVMGLAHNRRHGEVGSEDAIGIDNGTGTRADASVPVALMPKILEGLEFAWGPALERHGEPGKSAAADTFC
mmetsp:Transcript_68797/g.119471  ORF Transcript_68797/g.119471 Transcript_68797/m.119471 type:complete len:195 (-) Transcript_68797:613-1197(-)